MENVRKTCPVCGSMLSGRSDKKFCDDGCRTTFNNRRWQQESEDIRKTDSILRRNRKILQSYSQSREAVCLSKAHLMASGFRPDFVTRIAPDPSGGLIRYYYEYGLRKLSGEEFQVFRQN
jgi:hypothetical protein